VYGLAVVLLVSTGVFLRLVRISRAAEAALYTPPARPLGDLPKQIAFFTYVQDVPMAATVLDVAGVDASIQRDYIDVVSGRHLLLYVGYWGRENQGLGHGPDVCYPAVGWTPAARPQERTLNIGGDSGVFSGGLVLHRFTRAEPEGVEKRVVGFTAIVSGQYKGSSLEVFWHRPGRLAGGPGHYLAHVQVSCSVPDDAWEPAESDIVGFMEAFLPHLSECLPHSPDEGKEGSIPSTRKRTDVRG